MDPILDDVLLSLSTALERDELVNIVESSIHSLFSATSLVFVRTFDNGDDLALAESTTPKGEAAPIRLPSAGAARQCYWTSERVNRSLTSLINANDPLAPLLKRIAAADDDGSSQISFIPIATSATSAPAATKSVMMIIVTIRAKSFGANDEKLLLAFLRHVTAAVDRVHKHGFLVAERDRLNGMLSMCSELIDQNSAMLTRKILGHLKHETECRSCTMLMVDDGMHDLVCQVFDLKELEKEFRLSLDDTLFGYVAKTGDCVNIEDVSKDLRFDPVKDHIGTYAPQSLLCMPVFSKVDPKEIIAVAVIYDKLGHRKFTRWDEEKMRFVLKFCSSVLHNTLVFQKERNLKAQTQALLDVAEVLFTHVESMDVLLQKIMEEARKLTKAERCSLFLLDYETQELVAKIFDSSLNRTGGNERDIRFPLTQGIAGYVATTGEVLNIKDAYSHELFYKDVDLATGFRTRNILCFPIKNEENMIIGVAQLCNKVGAEHFSMEDETLALQFSAYCAISIHQSMLYKGVMDAQNRSQLANELMLYHMQVNETELARLAENPYFDGGPEMSRCSFLPRSVPAKDTPTACMTFFDEMGLIKKWRISSEVLAKFILMTNNGYRNPVYHNWTHAFSVAHFCFALFQTCQKFDFLRDLEIFSLIIGTLCHDLDHRGTNNAYQVSSHSVLAALYSSEGSVMEHHHFAQTLCILNSPGCNILENLTAQQYTDMLDLLRNNILATDLSHHLRIVKHLQAMAQTGFDPENPDHHHLLLCLLMTSCDLCACTKSWESAQAVAELIYTEFFSQGDLERAIGMQPMEMMDRDRACIPELQLNFLDFIAIPVYRLLSQILPETSDVYERVLDGREQWRMKTEEIKRERGLNLLNTHREEAELQLRLASMRNRGATLQHGESIPESLPNSLPDISESSGGGGAVLVGGGRKISSASDPGPELKASWSSHRRGGGSGGGTSKLDEKSINGLDHLQTAANGDGDDDDGAQGKKSTSSLGSTQWRQCSSPKLSTGSDSSEASRQHQVVVETS
ncbi:cGMP-dependent 3',5'-cyclic phosphodiesterase-like [Oscarella lobularis]|uniref:cGMP-dependent 3',5'-cyclic phosphodiesterase-like n=1 Tax=Oscarella lobularis TaxID=121494 RepID=UPI0033137ABA